MNYIFTKIKKIRSHLLIITLILAGNSGLKGTQTDFLGEENVSTSSHTTPLLKVEPVEASSLSNLQLGLNIPSQEAKEEITIGGESNGISNSYLLAFQENLEDRISCSEGFKYFICLVGGIGPFIPQIAISQSIADSYESELLGYALIATSALTIEAITSWMIWELIEDTKDLLKTIKQEQGNASLCNLKFLKNIAIGGSSAVLGVLSSTPDVYIKFKYNKIKEFALISLVYDSIPRIIGFYKLFSSMKWNIIKKIWKEPSIDERRGTNIVNLSKAYFLQKCKTNGIESVRGSLSNYTTPHEIYSYLTSHIEPNFIDEDSPHAFARGIPRKVIKCLAVIPPIASASFNIAMAYRGYNLIINNAPSSMILSVFSVIPAFLLSSYVTMEAAGDIFDKIYLWRSPIPSSDYFASFYPKINVALIGTSLVLAAFTSFSNFYIIANNLEDTILEPLKYIVAALAVGTDFTFGTFTIYSTFKRYAELICRKCSKGASYVINCSRKLSELSNSFINFSSNLLKSFVDDTVSEQN